MLVRERQSAGSDDASSGDLDPRRRAARRGVIGALAGALVMLVAATALAANGVSVPFLGLASDRGPERAVSGGGLFSAGVDDPPPLTSAPGRCLDWDRQDGSDVREVDCGASHLFETVGAITAPQPPGTPFPGDDAWQQAVDQQCTPMARTYLGGRLDPAGRYRAGALKPTRTAWGEGDRTVRCGLQAPGRTGALFTSTGRVTDADQAVVFDAGTCLGLTGKEVSDPVDCARTHAAEVAGTVDLGTQFREGAPSVDDQDNYLQPTCQKIAEDHVGGAQKLTDSRLTVYWTNLSTESWDAGTRRVDCNLGALLGDGSGFAPLTGRAADGVTIRDSAPAEPEPLPAPGAPAGRAATGGSADEQAPADGSSGADSEQGPAAGVPSPTRPAQPARPTQPQPSVLPSAPLPLPSVPLPGLGG